MRLLSAACFLLGASACFTSAWGAPSEKGLSSLEKGPRHLTKLRQISSHQPPSRLQKNWPRFAEPELHSQTNLLNADAAESLGESKAGAEVKEPAEEGAVALQAPPADDFLIVPHTRTYCEGNSIKLAEDMSTSGAKSVEEARQACAENPECSFFSYGRAHTIEEPLPTGFKTGVLPGTGASWYCNGQGWMGSTRTGYWVLMVKGSTLRAAAPNYAVHLNTSAGICAGENRIKVVSGLLSFSDAASACDENPACSYFVLNASSSTDAPGTPRQNEAHFCSGSPSNPTGEEGWILATRKRLLQQLRGEPVDLVPVQAGHRPGRNGSITQDEYYYYKPCGTVVQATKITTKTF
uniref:PAN domain protein n=1 Tax=Toxoplasma gondii COUG TaxID=1074873 RepID=A0A2G8YCM9_TOXGO|nr:PAN domain protein [Toxoplasma gondii COUG]